MSLLGALSKLYGSIIVANVPWELNDHGNSMEAQESQKLFESSTATEVSQKLNSRGSSAKFWWS